MNRLVLDASVALKMIFVSEIHAPLALDLQADFRNKVIDLIAPDFLPAEIGHSLMRAERKGIIKPGDGKPLFDQFVNPCPTLYDYADVFDRAIEIASQFRCGFYDCCYVALAERESCELVTTDDKLNVNLPGFPIVHLATL